MSDTPTYYLIRYCHGRAGFTAYAHRSNIFNIANFPDYQITRYYPYPPVNLTPRITILQRRWLLYLALRRWKGHPLRLQFRALYGRFPPIPEAFRKVANVQGMRDLNFANIM